MPALGSGTNAQPFKTVQDYENWLKRLDGLVVWMDQAIVNMREGAAHRRRAAAAADGEGAAAARRDDRRRAARQPVLRAGDAVPGRASPRPIATSDGRVHRADRDKLVPAYRRLRDFVRDEYLPQTRSTVAWTALPDGQAWYAYYVQEHTTTT